MFNDNNDMVIPDTFHDGPTLSTTTTSIPSTSSSNTSKPKDASTSSYLDIPSSSSFRRPSRPSLDSTYTDLSELSFASADLHSQSHPLMRAPSNTTPQSTPTTFRARLQRLYVHNYGALLVLLAQFFGVLMNLSTRMLEQNGSHGAGMHPFQILFVRQFITSLTCTLWATLLPIMKPQSKNLIPDFPLGPKSTSVRLLLLTRGVSGFLGVFGMYFSLLYLPLSEATVLTFLAPILTCYLCSWVIPGEKFSRQQQLAGLVSLIGVVFIARPASFFVSPTTNTQGVGQVASNSTMAETAPTEGYAHPNPSPSEHLLAIGIALLGVIGSTGAMTSIRAIGNRAHPFLSINYFSVFCTIMSLICLLVFKDVKFRLPGNWTEWGLLGSLGVCGFVMQWLLTRGLAYGSRTHASPAPALGKSGTEVEEDVEMGESAADGPKATANCVVKKNAYSDNKEAPIKGSGTRATSMVYTQMLFALAGDKLVFGVTPGTMSWIGSGLILGGAIWVASARDKDSQTPGHQARSTGDTGQGSTAAPNSMAMGGLGTVFGRQKEEESRQGDREETVGLMSAVDDADEQTGMELDDLRTSHDRA